MLFKRGKIAYIYIHEGIFVNKRVNALLYIVNYRKNKTEIKP